MNEVSTTTLTDKDRGLVAELVVGITPTAEILTRYGVTAQALIDRVKTDPDFRVYLQDAKLAWKATQNTNARVRAAAAASLETLLPHFVAAVQGQGASVQAKRDAVETLARLANNWETEKAKKDQSGPQNQFKIVINLGPKPEDQRVIEGKVVPPKDPQ